MVDSAPIPASPSELSPAWLTATMRAAGAIAPTATVSGFEVGAIGGSGLGLSGETVRVRLRYAGDAADGPASVVAKFPTTDPANRGLVEALDVYRREIEFYRDIATDVPCRVPAHLGSAYDPVPSVAQAKAHVNRVIDRLPARAHLALTREITKFMRPTRRRYALLIEDVQGATVHDLADPPPIERVHQQLQDLADLHAAFWGRTDLVDHLATRLVLTDIPNTFVNVFRGRCMAMAEERWSEWMTPRVKEVLDGTAVHFAHDIELVNRPRTLLHGDPRSDNVLYFDDQPAVHLDWGQPAVGHPAYDVAYALTANVRVADHARHGAELVDTYLDRIGDAGIDLDRDDFVATMHCTARALALQNINGLSVLTGDYGENGVLADMWVPRALALLGVAPAVDV